MATKYNKDSFRDRALGTQRFQGSAVQPLFRRRLSLRQSNRLVIVITTILIAGAFFGQRITDSFRGSITEYAEGRIIGKEVRALEKAQEIYALYFEFEPISIKSDDMNAEPYRGGLAVERSLWEQFQTDDPVQIEYTPSGRWRPLHILSVKSLPLPAPNPS